MFKKNAVLLLGCLAFLPLFTPAAWGVSQMFQPAQTYLSGGAYARSVAVADINRDGKLDLIVTSQCDDDLNCQSGLVGVLFGNGDGTFQTVHTYNSGGLGANSVALGDVNGDGKPDLLVTNDKGGVGVLLGNDDGTFQPAQSYSSGGGAGMIALGDVNGDGKLDLLVTNFCGDDPSCHKGLVGVLLGNGDGTFQTAQMYNSGGYGPLSLAVADVNRDGKLDLLVTNMCPIDNLNCQNGGVAGVMLGNGDGTFQAVQTYNSGGFYATSIAVDDVNGDGRLDLLVANQCASVKADCFNAAGVVGVLLGNGDGTFEKAQHFASGGLVATSVTVGDVNGDGKPDLLTTNVCHGYNNCDLSVVGVLLGNGDGTFQKAQSYGSGGSDARFIAVADVNRDGKPDLLTANGCTLGVDCNRGGSVGVLLARHLTATALTSNLNPSIYGQGVTLRATVSSDGPSAPTGTVTFNDGTKWMGKATLNGGVATVTTNNLPVRTLSITARYNGDPDFVKSTSAAVIQVVNPATTMTTIKSSVNPSVVGQPVTFTANVTSPTAKATGTVTFTAGATTLGSVTLKGGKASVTTSALPKGSNTITATYEGTNNTIGSAASLTQTVN